MRLISLFVAFLAFLPMPSQAKELTPPVIGESFDFTPTLRNVALLCDRAEEVIEILEAQTVSMTEAIAKYRAINEVRNEFNETPCASFPYQAQQTVRATVVGNAVTISDIKWTPRAANYPTTLHVVLIIYERSDGRKVSGAISWPVAAVEGEPKGESL